MQKNINSLVTFKNSQGIEARGTLLKLSRTTIVFEVYNPYSIIQLSEVLQELSIRRNDEVIYRGKAVVSNLLNTGLMLVVSATLVDPWSDLSHLLHNADALKDELEAFLTNWEESHQLDPSYQVAVADLRSFLSELHAWLEQTDLDDTPQDTPLSAANISPKITEEMLASLAPKGVELFEKFEVAAANISPEQTLAHKNYAQRDIHPLIMRSPFAYRAYSKPLGYAGDYEMVNMMLRSPTEGPTLYAQLFNAINLQMGVARAHANRIDILVDWLERSTANLPDDSRAIELLNIGCGPAIEVQRFIGTGSNAHRCHASLVDFSDVTLEYTKQMISNAKDEHKSAMAIDFIHNSVHQLLKQASQKNTSEEDNKYDVAYCAGLFDYLSDKVCARLIRLFYRWTKPGGNIMLTNVHSDNPNRMAMEHLLEWHLIYRDEDGMRALTPELGEQRVYTDDTGVNVFLEIHKPL